MWTKLLLLFLYFNGILTQDFINETDCPDVTDLTVYSKGPNYMKLSWTPVTNVTRYRIDYQHFTGLPYHKEVNSSFCTIWKNKYCVNFDNDVGDKIEYIVRVAPIIEDDFCEPKSKIIVFTNSSESSPVLNLTYEWNENILKLTWNHPEQTNGDLEFFVINLKNLYMEMNKTLLLASEEDYKFSYYKEIPIHPLRILEMFPSNVTVYGYNGYKGEESVILVPPPKNALQLATSIHLNWNNKDELEVTWTNLQRTKSFQIVVENLRNGAVENYNVPGINNKFIVKKIFEWSTNYTITLVANRDNGTIVLGKRQCTSPPKKPITKPPDILYTTNTSIVFTIEDLEKAVDKNSESYMIIIANISSNLNHTFNGDISYHLQSINILPKHSVLFICKNNSDPPIFFWKLTRLSQDKFIIGDLEPSNTYNVTIFFVNIGQNGTLNKIEKHTFIAFTDFYYYGNTASMGLLLSGVAVLVIFIIISLTCTFCYIRRSRQKDILFVSSQQLVEENKFNVENAIPEEKEEPIYETIDELVYDYAVLPGQELKLDEISKKNRYIEVLW